MYAIYSYVLVSIWLSHAVTSIPMQNSGMHFIKAVFSDWSNKFRYRKYDLEQYREAISSKVTESIEKFRSDQLLAQSVARKDLESYMDKFNQLYAKNLAALEKQMEAVEDMRKKMEIKRPPKIDDSLEQFRQFYNESVILGPYESVSKHLKFSFVEKRNVTLDKKDNLDPIFFEESIVRQTERLRDRLQGDWNNLFRFYTDDKKRSKKVTMKKISKTTGPMEKVMRTAALDLNKIQEDLALNAKLLALSTQKSIMTTIDKKNIRKERRNLEAQLKKLNREGISLFAF